MRVSPPAWVISYDVKGTFHSLPWMNKAHLLSSTLSEDTVYCEPTVSTVYHTTPHDTT